MLTSLPLRIQLMIENEWVWESAHLVDLVLITLGWSQSGSTDDWHRHL